MQEKNRFDNLIEETVGLSLGVIKSKSVDDIHRHIEERGHFSLKLGQLNPGSMYRGNMLLASGRINYDVDARFNDTFGIDE